MSLPIDPSVPGSNLGTWPLHRLLCEHCIQTVNIVIISKMLKLCIFVGCFLYNNFRSRGDSMEVEVEGKAAPEPEDIRQLGI